MKPLAALIFLPALMIGPTSCRPQPSPTVFLDPALAVLVPSDTTLLAGIRMQRIRGTQLDEQVRNSPRFINFRNSIGLVGESDIWEYLIASNGTQWIALLRGKFTEMGMEPRVNKPSARRESYNGVAVIGDEKGAIAFLNPTTAVAGPFDSVLRALEQRNNNVGIPDALQKLSEEIPANNEAWFTTIGPAPGFLPGPSLPAGRGGFDPRSNVVDIRLEAESEGAARSIAEALNGTAEGVRVTAKGPAPAYLIDWMLGKTGRGPAAR